MWNVILGFARHPSVGSENYTNLCGNLMVGNVPWAEGCF